MNIILTNMHSTQSNGDAALLNISVQLVREAYPNANISIVINDQICPIPAGTKRVQSLVSRLKNGGSRWSIKSLCLLPFYLIMIAWHCMTGRVIGRRLFPSHHAWAQTYKNADIVISVPGTFLYSSGKLGIPFALIIAEMAFSTALSIPTFIFPQSFGPVWRKRDQKMLSWLSHRLTAIFTRDAKSADIIANIGGRTDHITVTPDIAFAYAPVSPKLGTQLLQKYHVPLDETPLLGITAINWHGMYNLFMGQAEYEHTLEQTIAHFVNTYNGHVVLFSQVYGPASVDDDRLTMERIFAKIGSMNGRVTFINEKIPVDTLKSAYGRMDAFIGTRLHSNIFALTEHVPVVAIAYQPKTRGVLKLLDLEAWVIDIEDVSAATLIPMLDALWQQKADVKTHIRHQLTTIHAQLHTIVEQLERLR